MYEKTETTYTLDLDAEIIGRFQFRNPHEARVIAQEGEAGRVRIANMTQRESDRFDDVAKEKAPEEENLFSVDGTHFGSLARYFNSSCDPTMNMHSVYIGELQSLSTLQDMP